jgi:hypothetical protein
MNYWHQANRGKFYFRGEHNSNWQLISSAARKGLLPDTSNLLECSAGELRALRVFQSKVQSDQELFSSVFPDGRLLSLNSSDWWALKQHYEGGTRLIDVTSSIFSALFFACADWDGSIDQDTDGAIYLFPTENWRKDVLQPDIIRGQNVGPTDQMQPLVETYFSIENHPDTVRFRESHHRNDRLIAQDGFFLWQPIFDQPLNLGQHFKFRIPGQCKINLLEEMYSIGYTAERLIRGTQGSIAYNKICPLLRVAA